MRVALIILPCIFVSHVMGVQYTQVDPQPEQLTIPALINIPYAKDYIQIGKGTWNASVESIVGRDQFFLHANGMLTDPKYFVQKNMPNSTDPESKDKTMSMRAVPDYMNAIKELSQSAKTYQNPVSAYEAVVLSLRMFGKGQGNPIVSDMPILTKLLYINQVCEGYVLYGEHLESMGNKMGAYEVYQKGANEKKCTGWYQSVLGGKISVMKKSTGR